MIRRRVVLVIDDDEDNREWAQQAYLGERPVLTVPVEKAWETIIRMAEPLSTVLINIKDYQKGLAFAVLVAAAGSFHVGVTSATMPDILKRMSLDINRTLVTLNGGDAFLLTDGKQDWTTLFESLTDYSL